MIALLNFAKSAAPVVGRATGRAALKIAGTVITSVCAKLTYDWVKKHWGSVERRNGSDIYSTLGIKRESVLKYTSESISEGPILGMKLSYPRMSIPAIAFCIEAGISGEEAYRMVPEGPITTKSLKKGQ